MQDDNDHASHLKDRHTQVGLQGMQFARLAHSCRCAVRDRVRHVHVREQAERRSVLQANLFGGEVDGCV